MKHKFALPIVVENDVNAALVGEVWKGAGKRARNCVMISVGTGIGGAIMIDGRLFRGADYAAGELGYLAVDTKAIRGTFLEWGFLESVASGTAIAKRYSDEIMASQHAYSTQSPARSRGAVTAQHVFEAARAGDQVAVRIVEETAIYLGMAAANVAAVLDPERIILGGGVLGAADLLLNQITSVVAKLVPTRASIRLAQLGDEAALVGLAKRFLDSNGYFSEPSLRLNPPDA